MRGYTLVCILSYHSLKNKMTKKEKIKKIIQIIWNIVSIIFVTFISGALIINAIRGADEKTQDIVTPNIQEVKQRSNIISGNGRSICFTGGILSDSFLAHVCVVSNVVNDYINDNSKTSKQFYTGLETNTDPYTLAYPLMTNFDNVNYNDNTCNGREDWEWCGIGSILINVINMNTSYTGVKIINLSFLFMDILETPLITITCTLFLTGSQLNLDNYSFAYLSITNEYPDVFSHIGNICIIYKNDSLFGTLIEPDEDSYYRGYEIGKQAGFYEGVVEGANGIQTNAFTVIGQTFSAIANILSIEVLPSFPLWILIFTPLIIAVVIVVVKMIKG